MTLVMTLLVRDEADIISPMLEYHLAAGVDKILVTDNGSIDGTREILGRYEADPRVVVDDDPLQDKNQSAKVTRLARRAAEHYRADWVINADADEFFVPLDRSLSLAAVFDRLPISIVSAVVPVIDMTGAPGPVGGGFDRLVYRDLRVEETLFARAGLHAHATHDAIHIGSPDVIVAQGNHYVSLPSAGSIPPELAFESLHFPWRSYRQFRQKVVNAGRSYESNPAVTPSPRHHGMRDYRFWRAGALEDAYIFRHPSTDECGGDELARDTWLSERLETILSSGSAVCSDLLLAALSANGEPYSDDRIYQARVVIPPALAIEQERADEAAASRERLTDLQREIESALRLVEASTNEASLSRDRADALIAELERVRADRAYRVASKVGRLYRATVAPLRRVRGRATL